VIASSKGFGVCALPETASNAAFALAAALSIVGLPFVTLALVGFFAFLVVAFAAFASPVFWAMLFFAPAVVAFALEEVFLTVAFFVDGGFFAPAGVLRLFVVFFAIGAFLAGAFFAFSLVGDMGGIIIGLGLLDKG
jgi:hypothetical protein